MLPTPTNLCWYKLCIHREEIRSEERGRSPPNQTVDGFQFPVAHKHTHTVQTFTHTHTHHARSNGTYPLRSSPLDVAAGFILLRSATYHFGEGRWNGQILVYGVHSSRMVQYPEVCSTHREILIT